MNGRLESICKTWRNQQLMLYFSVISSCDRNLVKEGWRKSLTNLIPVSSHDLQQKGLSFMVI